MHLPVHYLKWHYTTAYQDITRVWLNYLWFMAHFFSIALLLKTFFSPFKRIKEQNKKAFDLQALAETLAINLMMRLVGIILRTVLLAIGLSVVLVVFLGGIAFYTLWTFLPVVLLGLLLVGFGIIRL